jgi:hypothetical protein
MKTTRDVYVVALVKGSERYAFIFDDANRSEILQQIGRQAANPELSFTWYDAAAVSARVETLTTSTPTWRPERRRVMGHDEGGALLPAKATARWLRRVAVAPRDIVGSASDPASTTTSGSESPVAVPNREAPGAAHDSQLQFTLPTLMVIITLAAVLLRVATSLPSLGIIAAVLAGSAFVGMVATGVRRPANASKSLPLRREIR